MEGIRVEKICEIFKNRTNIDFDKNVDLRKENFFGLKLNINPRDLVMIYMDLKIIVGINFEEKDLLLKKFDTYENVIALVEKACGYSIVEKGR